MSESKELQPRVLVVDDSPAIAAVVAELLRGEDMAAVKCPSGRQALAILDAEHFDAVILDILMPEVNGYEVLRQMRLRARTAQIPVILLSASAKPEDIDKGLEMGATHYLTKPFNKSDLVRKLRACIQERTTSAPPDRE